VRLTGGAEELDKGLKLRRAQVAELLGVAVANRLVEGFEKGEASFGDADLHDAAVVGHSLSSDQFTVFKAVNEPRDVGRVGHQFSREDESRQG
jgi:hypothetical protein